VAHGRANPQAGINACVTVAYVVLSYKNPAQVLRLVSALRESPGSEVVVRHDQRRSPLAAAAVEERGGHLLDDGIDVAWGEFSYVEVLTGALESALAQFDPDWVLVLSGQDYPLRPPADTERWLGAAEADAFLTAAWELPTDERPPPPAEQFFMRYAYRHYRLPGWAPRAPARARRLFYTREMPAGLGTRLGIRRVRLPFGPRRRCFVSADWLTLSARAAREVTRVARDDRALMRFYERVLIPSESLFATILLNDPGLSVSFEDRRFLSFQGPAVPHPDVLTSAHLEALLESGMHFARKFDSEVDEEVLDALDEHRRSRSVPR
jgi:hypothetical protein